MKSREKIIKSAAGKIKADTVIRNAVIADVFSRRFIDGDIGIADGIFLGVGDYEAENEIDAGGAYVLPGFIDAHVHIESSMISPCEYLKTVSAKGVTSVIADPHEIANVCGEDGLEYMFLSAENCPADVHYMMPSCVPATPFDNSGAEFNSTMTRILMEKYNFLGLAEMMNYMGVVNCDNEVMSKLTCAEKIDGHSPMLSGNELNAYICAGISTDHECTCADEALEKISKGMYVLIREGTGAKNLESLMSVVNTGTLSRLCFCTDDKHISDILEEGTISHCVNKAINLGLSPIYAVCMATINTAQCYGLKNKGAIAPGYKADFIITKDFDLKNADVFKDGVKVAENGRSLSETVNETSVNVLGTVNLRPFSAESLEIPFEKGMTVIELQKESLITKKAKAESRENLSMCAVIERHRSIGNIGKAFIKGIQIKDGAVAQSIGHDSHNITVCGDNASDMKKAVDALGSTGGIAVVEKGEVKAFMPLEIAGLMSVRSAEEAGQMHDDVIEAISAICSEDNIGSLLMVLSFISLVVIPEIKLNDKGLFDVDEFKQM